MADAFKLKTIEGSTDTLRVLRPGKFPVFVGDDPAAPDFVCWRCEVPLIRGIPDLSSLAEIADGIECAGCFSIAEIPRQ